MAELPEWSKLLVAAASIIGTVAVAAGEARVGKRPSHRPARTARALRRVRAAQAHPPPQALPAPEAAVAPETRAWLLDGLPVEPRLPRGARVAGAGRLAIGIAAMGIAAAIAILGFSRALSAVVDRVLR